MGSEYDLTEGVLQQVQYRTLPYHLIPIFWRYYNI